MDLIGTRLKSKKQQRLDAELCLIIEEMEQAMWNADKDYMARSISLIVLTPRMHEVLAKFKGYCEKYYGK